MKTEHTDPTPSAPERLDIEWLRAAITTAWNEAVGSDPITLDDYHTGAVLAALTELAALRDTDQQRIDQVAHYRNLAIQLGATAEQMADGYDVHLYELWTAREKELAELREAARWRRFGDVRPSEGERVLVSGCEADGVDFAACAAEFSDEHWTNDNWHSDVFAEHDDRWLPLPQPPREVQP